MNCEDASSRFERSAKRIKSFFMDQNQFELGEISSSNRLDPKRAPLTKLLVALTR